MSMKDATLAWRPKLVCVRVDGWFRVKDGDAWISPPCRKASLAWWHAYRNLWSLRPKREDAP